MNSKTVVLGALVVASAIGGTLALGSGCTVLSNDAPPDDAGLFEGGDADGQAATCSVCLSAHCAAPQALCLTNAACTGVIACAAATSCDSTCQQGCACNASADGGPSPDRLHHAYTSCNDAKRTVCAAACAQAPATTLAPCTTQDGGTDAGDAGDASLDAEAPDADAPDAAAPGPDACLACATVSCGALVSACASGTECGQFLACSSACTTASCVDDCATQHATGKVAATELATCTASNCQNDCEL